jgi:hypothetical protein
LTGLNVGGAAGRLGARGDDEDDEEVFDENDADELVKGIPLPLVDVGAPFCCACYTLSNNGSRRPMKDDMLM